MTSDGRASPNPRQRRIVMRKKSTRRLLPILLLVGAAPASAQVISPTQFCDHPLLPLRIDAMIGGSAWSYAATGSEAASLERETESVVPVARDTALALLATTVASESDGDALAVPTAYLCSADGIRPASADQVSIPLPFGDLVIDIVLKSQEGVLLPPFEEMALGHSWQADYVVEVTILRGEDEKARIELGVTMDAMVAGFADVDVPAGQFIDTWVVDQRFAFSIQGRSRAALRPGLVRELAVPLDRTLYLAEGVGLVHLDSQGPRQGGESLDLVDYFIPQPTR
ncbi:hypothetical protein [Thiococcus pfennigii]|uniref:hypothetical protein n=1 Tax=Thiococcus pfennigii TaxID=1057 RepID=UPI001A923CE5|nr:hypothetical protein [Thiococcus pfennigii]